MDRAGEEVERDKTLLDMVVKAVTFRGMLKHGKVVDVNHLHVSLARTHASVL